MKSLTPLGARAPHVPRRQKGVVLFIALIVLVAMTLAGIAMVRSVDTSLGIAGNLAFRQASLQASDQGVQQAFAWLVANSAGTTLINDNATAAYKSAFTGDSNWFDPNNAIWNQTFVLNSGLLDQWGNKIEYIIHRMCTVSGQAYNGGGGQQCALYYPNVGGASGGSMSVGSAQFQGIPQIYYRVTVRVTGPRNSVAITQTNILIQV